MRRGGSGEETKELFIANILLCWRPADENFALSALTPNKPLRNNLSTQLQHRCLCLKKINKQGNG